MTGTRDGERRRDEEGLELANRFGNRPFTHQFLMQLNLLSVFMGDWGTWTDEIAAAEEEGVHAFYQSSFADVRAMVASLKGDDDLAAAELARADETGAVLASGATTGARRMTMAYVAFYRADWGSAVTLALEAGTTPNFSEEGPAGAFRRARRRRRHRPEVSERAIASRRRPYPWPAARRDRVAS